MLLQFYAYFMKHLYELMSWPEDMDMLWFCFYFLFHDSCHIDKKSRGT